MINSVDVSLRYINGNIEIQLIFKELTLRQLKKVPVGKYYFFEVNIENKKMGVELKAKVCLPLQNVNQINLKNNRGEIGNVSYQLNSNGTLLMKTTNRISDNKVEKVDNKYLINIVDDNKSIINIHYSVPEEIYHRTIPMNSLTKAEAKVQAQKITDQILAGNYPNEPQNNKKTNERKKNDLTNKKPKKTQQAIRIWVAKDTAFKRCEHCINLRAKNHCVVHKKTVQSNNACSRFFTPKIYFGGSVSPR
jgi:hypothetical protein